MATPDPEGMSLLAKIATAATAIIAPLWGGWKYIDARLDRKADKKDVEKGFEKIDEELMMHRSYFGKVFDQMRDGEQRAQDRHERILERLPK